jgi:predicted DCC family thiol-disulfide oxidoreductase YuxK
MFFPQPIILFDGVCNLCNGLVRFVIRQDKRKVFRFASLQSQTGKDWLSQMSVRKPGIDSFVFIENGKAYTKSTAALKVAAHLPWYWRWTLIAWILPRFMRDGLYNLVARNRYFLFGRKISCMVPTAAVRDRFL